MKYIITSGPMDTKIDGVRKIKNSSTGQLGATFVEILNKASKNEIVYIHTAGAILPSSKCKRILIEDHQQLLKALESELTNDSVVVHAMAISDFDISGSITKNELANLFINNKQQLKCSQDVINLIDDHVRISDKLSSNEDQVIVMNKSIKVIDRIKQINPNCKLIGFKLLSNVSEDELINVGKSIKQRANCDYVVANLKEQVGVEMHRGFIIGDEDIYELHSKEQIANKIIELMED